MRRTALWRISALSMVVATSLAVAACGGGDNGGNTGGGGGEEAAVDNLSGAGASFPDPVYQRMFENYNQETGVQVNYDPVGSGGGREQFINDTVDFAGSDDPMSQEEEQQAGGDPLHIPTVGGAVVMAYNIPELGGDTQLNLTGPVVAQMYLGEITNWSDPAIQDLNPDVQLPDADITVAHRSDGSGTTAIWSTYLANVSQAWNNQVGAGDELDWPTGVGGEGNDGVTNQVEQTENSIGYVGLEYAESSSDLNYAALSNSADGNFVVPSTDTASNAIDAVSDQIPPDLKLILTEATPQAEGEDIYPITGLTWLLVRSEMEDLDTCKGVANLAWYMTHEGQSVAPEENYVPIPDSLVSADEGKIAQMQAEGEQCYPDAGSPGGSTIMEETSGGGTMMEETMMEETMMEETMMEETSGG